VEQLCAKFDDMPSIDIRGIVSSAGYSKPAARKARRKGVELFLFEEWDPKQRVENAILPSDFLVIDDFKQWVGQTDLRFELEGSGEPGHLAPTSPLYDEGGGLHADFRDVESLGARVLADVSSTGNAVEESGELLPGERRQIRFRAEIESRPQLLLDGRLTVIRAVEGDGTLERVVRNQLPQLRILRRLETPTPYLGCAVFETLAGSLGAVAVDANDGSLRMLNINPDHRTLKQIRRQRV
jgi:hypothetical protein